MFSHVCMGVTDVERAYAFYAPLMEALQLALKFRDPDGWTGWMPADAPRPLFLIGLPFDGAPHSPGNGQMTALLAANRAMVDRVYALALQAGGTSEGAPGLRPHYHPNYYGAYFRDLDGNKLCVCCHEPE
ncbi:VOC family protein [Burkholderia oklahomensis]|uniref:VOC family protein n=1 Tax=Burkholderia oklahomensis TaxID=342113 RepID=UPI000473756A|nr:VOC family protein [Burkholderia oklahomensis]AJX36002.1 glyoxalase-like domain protein [Burkholderia oklahomensis C6786]AOI48417.1 glyoxalase [Burkholderia oklahomensis C6786]KUY52226.1 glyoxalase [Burkholderia oklahomensis C6786]MBI0363428.1 VOC family protein [Burkholderia oklahomensis]MDN7672587.1 VOC family protein [Burkholderia oklahomensis]